METQARYFDETDAEHLFYALASCREFLKRNGIESTDVRVQATDGGNWSLHTGSSDYDTDHRGYWGASSIEATDDDAKLGRILADIVNQACDRAAEDIESGMPDDTEIEAICRHVAQ